MSKVAKLDSAAAVAAAKAAGGTPYRRAIFSLSWIDPAAGLGLVDKALKDTLSEEFVFKVEGFRFANFLEARIVVSESSGTILAGGFTERSKQYAGNSFLGLSAHLFKDSQSKKESAEHWTFTQTVGSRTVSPEKVAKAVSSGLGFGPIGDEVLKRLSGKAGKHIAMLPPIWTMLQLRISFDGSFEGKVLAHSLFPSVNFYAQTTVNFHGPSNDSWKDYDKRSSYDAVPQLMDWINEGWGGLRPPSRGGLGLAMAGNPWLVTR